jgi:hypothetical protein
VKSLTSPVDHRPFRSKTEDASDQSLHTKYGPLAIPELVAAVAQMSPKGEQPARRR